MGGRQENALSSYDTRHPVILHGSHPISKLLIRREHIRLLHAGPLLVAASLSSQYNFIGGIVQFSFNFRFGVFYSLHITQQ